MPQLLQTITFSTEDYQALIAERDGLRGELDELRDELDGIRGEPTLTRAQRDLVQERPRAYKHEWFGASSEGRTAGQLGLLNKAEALAAAGVAPAAEDRLGVAVAGHHRKKRGRKPPDPGLPGEVVR